MARQYTNTEQDFQSVSIEAGKDWAWTGGPAGGLIVVVTLRTLCVRNMAMASSDTNEQGVDGMSAVRYGALMGDNTVAHYYQHPDKVRNQRLRRWAGASWRAYQLLAGVQRMNEWRARLQLALVGALMARTGWTLAIRDNRTDTSELSRENAIRDVVAGISRWAGEADEPTCPACGESDTCECSAAAAGEASGARVEATQGADHDATVNVDWSSMGLVALPGIHGATYQSMWAGKFLPQVRQHCGTDGVTCLA